MSGACRGRLDSPKTFMREIRPRFSESASDASARMLRDTGQRAQELISTLPAPVPLCHRSPELGEHFPDQVTGTDC